MKIINAAIDDILFNADRKRDRKVLGILSLTALVMITVSIALTNMMSGLAFKTISTFGLSEAVSRYEQLDGVYYKKGDGLDSVHNVQSNLNIAVDVLFDRLPIEYTVSLHDGLIEEIDSLDSELMNLPQNTPSYDRHALQAERNIAYNVLNMMMHNEMYGVVDQDDIGRLICYINDYDLANYAKSGKWLTDDLKVYVSHLRNELHE